MEPYAGTDFVKAMDEFIQLSLVKGKDALCPIGNTVNGGVKDVNGGLVMEPLVVSSIPNGIRRASGKSGTYRWWSPQG